MLDSWVVAVLKFMASLFVIVIGVAALVIVIMYFVDRFQTKHTIRRNYPVIGRFRYLFEHIGEFFRQYFFAMDREEMPFNRAQRAWVYRASKDEKNTVAFGSTRNLDRRGAMIFMNCPFPVLDTDRAETERKVIGPYSEKPYEPKSFFNISGMSYGALSRPAVRALSNGAKKAGVWLNTGEGGISPFHLESGCDVVYQLGTAKYGARHDDGSLNVEKLKEKVAHEQVKMIELKLAQGAKPGKGGVLPGGKVTEEIAEIRGIPVGKPSLSPNRHVDAKNTPELLDLIDKIRKGSGLPVGIKMVMGSEKWLHELFTEVRKRGIESAPDFITIDGGDGGTGAAPQSLMDDVGLPLKEALPRLADVRDQYGLHKRVRIMASGKLITPAEVAWALCAGADFVNNARGFMFSLGCIQALKCNTNECPTGVTTHDPKLQKGLVVSDKSERVAHYAQHMIREVETIAHSCGVTEPRQLKRSHVRVVMSNELSVPLDELFPYQETMPEYAD